MKYEHDEIGWIDDPTPEESQEWCETSEETEARKLREMGFQSRAEYEEFLNFNEIGKEIR